MTYLMILLATAFLLAVHSLVVAHRDDRGSATPPASRFADPMLMPPARRG